jgi:roadblock/LC7 domain-containing protein
LKLVVELVLRTNADADEQREGRTATGPGSSAGGGRELAGHDPDVVRITAASPPAVALAQRSDPAGGDPDSRLAPHIPDDAGGRGPTPHGAVVAVSTPAAAAVQLASPDANLLPLPMTVAVVNKHIVTANCHLLELFSDAYMNAPSMTWYHCCGAQLSAVLHHVLAIGDKGRVRAYLKAHFCGKNRYDRSMPFSSIREARGRAMPCQLEYHRRVCEHVMMILANDDDGLERVALDLAQMCAALARAHASSRAPSCRPLLKHAQV